jgi:transcription termination factor Rho
MSESTVEKPSKRSPKTVAKSAAKRPRKTSDATLETANDRGGAMVPVADVGSVSSGISEVSTAPAKAAKRTRKPKAQVDSDSVESGDSEGAPTSEGVPKVRRTRKKADVSNDTPTIETPDHSGSVSGSVKHGHDSFTPSSAPAVQRASDESSASDAQRKPYPVYVPLHVAKQMEQEGKTAPLAVAPDAQQAAQIRAAAFENRHGSGPQAAGAAIVTPAPSQGQGQSEGGGDAPRQDHGDRTQGNRPQGRDRNDRHDRNDRRRGRKDRGNRGDRGDRHERGGDRHERPDRHERHQGGRREDHEHGGHSSQPLPPPTPEELFPGEGIIEVSGKGFGFLRDAKRNYVQSPSDIFVSPEMVRRFNLRDGQLIQGDVRRSGRGQQMHEIRTVNGDPPEASIIQPPFDELTVINPNEPLRMETNPERYTTRVLDIVAPIGKGQRGLIVAPPRTGKTTFLQHIADAVVKNHPDVHLIMLLVDERPEEVTEIRHTVPTAEIMASSNDMDVRSHTRIAELAIERAKRLVEAGKDVFILLDSITRLGRAFNNAMTNGGRTMSGGMDARALEIPRRLFAAARNTEEAGSLTIIATALVETGSRMDELIFQEFKGTGNMELVLDRKIAEQRVYPAVEIFQSGTRREELLVPADLLNRIHFLRRGLAGCRPLDAIERLLFFLKKFPTNEQMLREIKVQ